MSAANYTKALITTVAKWIAARIRERNEHNANVCMAFVANRFAFAGLTEKQQISIFNAAMSLYGVNAKLAKDLYDTEYMDRNIALARKQTPVPFVWVHQRYAPYPMPGKPSFRSLQAIYEDARKLETYVDLPNDAPDYTSAVIGLSESNAQDGASPEQLAWIAACEKHGLRGFLRQQFARSGGFTVAVAEDVKDRPSREKVGGKRSKSVEAEIAAFATVATAQPTPAAPTPATAQPEPEAVDPFAGISPEVLATLSPEQIEAIVKARG